MFDRPQVGRAWFEQTIRDQLTLGAPIASPSSSAGGQPPHPRALPHPRHHPWCRAGDPGARQGLNVKQYFKEGRALRTETTVSDTRDLGIGRLLCQDTWDALVHIGHQVNERLLEAQLEACACAPDAATLQRVVLPSTQDRQSASGLPFGDPA